MGSLIRTGIIHIFTSVGLILASVVLLLLINEVKRIKDRVKKLEAKRDHTE